ncbi:hypothetical protein BGZ73_002598 [Actinomortierella ambigua]|nr:hypothetical protein BGZ73_002598 [Actinomortierella ambigua]
MSSLHYHEMATGFQALDDTTQNYAPRSAMSLNDMMALLSSSSQFSNESTAAEAAAAAVAAAAAAAAASGGGHPWHHEPNYVTSTVAPVGGHRRNHI